MFWVAYRIISCSLFWVSALSTASLCSSPWCGQSMTAIASTSIR